MDDLILALEFVNNPSAAGLMAWQKRMGFTYDSASHALGMSRSGYARMLAGESSGRPVTIKTGLDKRTALACLAIEAKLVPRPTT